MDQPAPAVAIPTRHRTLHIVQITAVASLHLFSTFSMQGPYSCTDTARIRASTLQPNKDRRASARSTSCATVLKPLTRARSSGSSRRAACASPGDP